MNKCKVKSSLFFNAQVIRGLRNGLDWMKFDKAISKEVRYPNVIPASGKIIQK